MRSVLMLTGLVAIAVVACRAPQEQRAAGGAGKEEEAVRAVVERFENGWNQRDARALASAFTADGDYRVETGEWLRGRQEIEAFHRGRFAELPAGAVKEVEADRFRSIGDVIVVDGTASFGAPGEPPLFAVAFTAISSLEQGEWRLAALRTTELR